MFAAAVGEGFELELGPWTVLGRQALTQQAYYPDFDAVALAPCRLLRLTRPAFLAALETTQVPAILSQVIWLQDPLGAAAIAYMIMISAASSHRKAKLAMRNNFCDISSVNTLHICQQEVAARAKFIEPARLQTRVS